MIARTLWLMMWSAPANASWMPASGRISSPMRSFSKHITASAYCWIARKASCACCAAPSALEGKRQRRAHEHERVLFARRFDDQRRRARTGAAAQARADDHQRHAGQRRADFVDGLLRRGETQFRVAARAEAARDVAAQLDFLRGHRARQRLHVRVAGHQVHVDRTFEHEPVQRVGPGSADADDLDAEIRVGGVRACDVRWLVISFMVRRLRRWSSEGNRSGSDGSAAASSAAEKRPFRRDQSDGSGCSIWRELRVLDEAERGGKLRVGERGGNALQRRRLRGLHGQAEHLLRQMVDAVDQAAPAGQHRARAEVAQSAARLPTGA